MNFKTLKRILALSENIVTFWLSGKTVRICLTPCNSELLFVCSPLMHAKQFKLLFGPKYTPHPA